MRFSIFILAFAISLPVITSAMPERPNAAASKKPAVASEVWTPPPFERYSGIINRMPFGTPPEPVAIPQSASLVPPPPAFVNQLTLCALNRTPEGAIEVGIVDASQKPPRNYYLNVGESADDLQIVSAEYDADTVYVKKAGVDLTLRLGKGPTIPGANKTPDLAMATTPALSTPSVVESPLPQVRAPDAGESYAERLQRRRVEIMKQRAEEAKKIRTEAEKEVIAQKEKEAAVEMEKNLRAKNLDIIRAGEPPLPMQLTPEEDALLVKEGVLPPQ
jgi:hypothetical protein